MKITIRARVLLSLGCLLIAYAAGMVTLATIPVAPGWLATRLGAFSVDLSFHAIWFALLTVGGWLGFLLPFVVVRPGNAFRKPLTAAVIGGLVGIGILEVVLLALLRPSSILLPEYSRIFVGYGVCAGVIGFLATGIYTFTVRILLDRISRPCPRYP